jgi:hypothetical protein
MHRACGGSPPHERLRSRISRHLLQCCPFWCPRGIPAGRHYPRGTGRGAGGGLPGVHKIATNPQTRFLLQTVARNCRITAVPRQTSKSTRVSILCASMSGASGAPPMAPKNAKRNEKDRKRRADGLLRHISRISPRRRRRSTTCTAA